MNDPNQLPRPEFLRTSFFLREDFAIELGFTDWMREPYELKRYVDYCRVCNRTFSYEGLQDWNRRRAGYVLPPLMGYYLAVAPKETTPTALLWDGRTHMVLTERAGLFADLMMRVKLITGIGDESKLPIVPPACAQPPKVWCFPAAMVVHDRERSLAGIVPLERARALLRPVPSAGA